MTLVDEILEQVKKLPPEKQLDVLAYVRKVGQGSGPRVPDIYGLWAGVEVTEEDIDRAREEMARRFPRDDL
ncbi:hypothetical protein [Deferrisoma palaeochoriense]